MRFFKSGIFLLALAYFFCGCETYKNIPYFGDLSDSAKLNVIKPRYNDLLIAPDDILSINIQTIDPVSNALFAQSLGSTSQTANSNSQSAPNSATGVQAVPGAGGFLINKNGDITLPVLGNFHLAGLTTLAAQDTIQKRASIYYKEPTVYVRFANFKITVLGEVQRAGTFLLPNEKVTIFDALGLAGDLTIFGKRENVLLIRDSADQNKLVRINLNSKDIVKSDFYYLKKNDVIYVEPNKAKLSNLDASKTRNYTIAAAVLSVLIIAATRIK